MVVTTPTYPLDIEKTDTKGTLLEGAKFRLYKNEGDAKAANDNAIKVTGSNGSYTVAENQNTESNMDMVTKKTEVSAGYNLHLNGLKAGTYWLVEKEAPAGYNKLTAPIKITITPVSYTHLILELRPTHMLEALTELWQIVSVSIPACLTLRMWFQKSMQAVLREEQP